MEKGRQCEYGPPTKDKESHSLLNKQNLLKPALNNIIINLRLFHITQCVADTSTKGHSKNTRAPFYGVSQAR